MKARDIDNMEFNSLDEFLKFVEASEFKWFDFFDLADLLLRLSDKVDSKEEKAYCLFEYEVFSYSVREGDIQPLAYSQNEGLDQSVFPDPDNTTPEVFKYVINRIEKTESPFLLARYNHILWKGPKGVKNNKYAIAAIENYIAAIYLFYNNFQKDEAAEGILFIGRMFENLVALANDLKYKDQELYNLVDFLLYDADKLEFFVKQGIIEDMYDYPKIFGKDHFNGIFELHYNFIKSSYDKVYELYIADSYLPLVIKIANKFQKDVKPWYDEIGFLNIKKAKSEKDDDRAMIKLMYLGKALEAFQKSGNKEQEKEAQRMYADTKKKVKLYNVKIGLTSDDELLFHQYEDFLKNSANESLTLPAEEIYAHLALDALLPTADMIKNFNDAGTDWKEHLTVLQFDKNKNIAKDTNPELRKKLEIYSYHINFGSLLYLVPLFSEGIKTGKLTYQNLIQYLIDFTWVGKNIPKKDLGGNRIDTLWINQIAPAIAEFFIQTKASLTSRYYKPIFILCMDSLSIKFEGIFRDFCLLREIPTSSSKPKGIQELNLNNLLEDPVVQEYFNEDDLLLFKYLFTNEGGLNIRNNIAHCFYEPSDYDLGKMILLICALLRIAKFDMTITQENVRDSDIKSE